MEIILTILLILAVGALGPIVGGATGITALNKSAILLVGAAFGYVLFGAENWPWIFAAMFILAVGERPGVGHPKGTFILGAENAEKPLERWQPEALRYKPLPAMALRGIIFGLPVIMLGLMRRLPDGWQEWLFAGLAAPALGLSLWRPELLTLPLAFALAMPLAAWLGTKLPRVLHMTPWRWSEALQYPIALFSIIVMRF